MRNEQQRQNINIELVGGNKARLEEVRQFNGMTQKELVGRLINWFCDQSRTVQQLVLGQIPDEIAQDVAQLLLKKMASGGHADAGGLVGEIPPSQGAPAQAEAPVSGRVSAPRAQ